MDLMINNVTSQKNNCHNVDSYSFFTSQYLSPPRLLHSFIEGGGLDDNSISFTADKKLRRDSYLTASHLAASGIGILSVMTYWDTF